MADGSAPIVVPPEALPYDWTPRRKRIVVGFAGGGGSSIAIADALQVHPDAALNHWWPAIAAHSRNFPDCAHYQSDIFEVPCTSVLPGEEIGLAWFSPDCRHHSKAKGGAPVSARVRGLAWVVIQWAKVRRPDVIFMENVEEWLSWGPLIRRDDGRMVPDPDRVGETAKRFFRRLEQCGYTWAVKVSSAADYGDPTIRKRMMVIARRDGRPIVWPEPTHARRDRAAELGLKPHRAAADIIDFSRPCPSIFLTPAEAKALRVKRPLETATLKRIAKGLFRYTIASADPFIVPVTHKGDDRHHDVREPLRTMTTAPRGEFSLVAPVVTGCGGRLGQSAPMDPRDPYLTVTAKNDSALAEAQLVAPCVVRTDMASARFAGVNSAEEPFRTFTSSGGLAVAEADLVSANLIGLAHGDHADRPGLRVKDPRDPMNVIHAGGGNQGLVTAFMEQANTGMVGHDMRDGVSTIVSRGTTQRLVTAQINHFRTSNTGGGKADLETPLTVNVAGGNHHALLTAHVDAYYSTGSIGGDAAEPLRTTTAQARHSLIVAQLSAVADHGRRPQVLAFLREHFGQPTEADHADPLASPEARARFGIVLIPANDGGEPTVAFIVDVGMRMLDPATELARAMGWPPDYDLETDCTGARVTKTIITKLVGNGVCKGWASAHVRANCADLPWWKDPTTPSTDRAGEPVSSGDPQPQSEAA